MIYYSYVKWDTSGTRLYTAVTCVEPPRVPPPAQAPSFSAFYRSSPANTAAARLDIGSIETQDEDGVRYFRTAPTDQPMQLLPSTYRELMQTREELVRMRDTVAARNALLRRRIDEYTRLLMTVCVAGVSQMNPSYCRKQHSYLALSKTFQPV
jgi:hypothetical protein